MSDLKERRFILLIFFAIVLLVFIGRLFYLQVLDKDLARFAEKNAIRGIPQQPSRGIIYDRNGKIYITNTPIFSLEIIPRKLIIPDTSMLEKYLRISKDTIRAIIANSKKYSKDKGSVFASTVNSEAFYPLIEKISWDAEGFEIMPRSARSYLYPVGANFLGYLSEVTKEEIDSSAGVYRPGDFIGRSGIEKQYEEILRGSKGIRRVLVNVQGKIVGNFADKKYDTLPVKGADIMISVDTELQQFAEELMRNKQGSIVCIEPQTGEILALVSSPAYDPNLLTPGSEFAQNYRMLENDSLKALFNRPFQAKYPPGSIFKIINGIAALEAGTLSLETTYSCAGGFARNGGIPGCHGHPGPLTLLGAIQYSCNAFFAATYIDLLNNRSRFHNLTEAFEFWTSFMNKFALGEKTGVDIPNESTGLIPSVEFYDNQIRRWIRGKIVKGYGRGNWKAMTTVSNAIGQGEVLLTTLQMANCVAAIANKGYYIRPHFFKAIINKPDSTKNYNIPKFEKVTISTRTDYYETIHEAMERVVTAGTGSNARIPGIRVCGKTGTAEDPPRKDHSIFFAFAPRENPKIAVAVLVQNAGWGNEWAAPISALLIEKYLRDTISDPWKLKRVLEAKFTPVREYAPPQVLFADSIKSAAPTAYKNLISTTPVTKQNIPNITGNYALKPKN